MSFWKEAMRPRMPIQVISGGRALNDAGQPIKAAVLAQGDKPGEIFAELTRKNRKAFKFERISWEKSAERSAGKAAAGAIVGGVLTGGIGAIAGAAIGGRKKDTSTAFLYLTDADGTEHEIHIECTKEQYSQIDKLPK